MQIVKAPSPWLPADTAPVIFLAGSIEMGTAENWQQRFEKYFEGEHVILLNPRRDDWDASWIQSIDNPQFNKQVTWELDGLDRCDLVVMRFDPNTTSPITLLELGLCAAKQDKPVYVCCPDGFWRQGNVEMICDRYDIPFFKKESEWMGAIVDCIRDMDHQ